MSRSGFLSCDHCARQLTRAARRAIDTGDDQRQVTVSNEIESATNDKLRNMIIALHTRILLRSPVDWRYTSWTPVHSCGHGMSCLRRGKTPTLGSVSAG